MKNTQDRNRSPGKDEFNALQKLANEILENKLLPPGTVNLVSSESDVWLVSRFLDNSDLEPHCREV